MIHRAGRNSRLMTSGTLRGVILLILFATMLSPAGILPKNSSIADSVRNRFLRYVVIDTQSRDGAETTPSAQKELDLARLLVQELHALGVSNAEVDVFGYVYASIPSNVPLNQPARAKVPPIGLIAHLDTSPDVSGTNVKPQVIESYAGGDILLPGNPASPILASENPKLKPFIGTSIITTDGTTLLGADDKAGCAVILTVVEELLRSPTILHGDVRICVTPDEEVDAGTKHFDLKKFGATFAYTVDGGTTGELNKETFSANSCILTVTGRDIHPGDAKNVMVNALRVASEFVALLPKTFTPETTEGYEPFIHPYEIAGDVGEAHVKMLLRDFKTPGLDSLKLIVEKTAAEVQSRYPKAAIDVRVTKSYRNMAEKIAEDPRVAEYLFEGATRAGAKPFWAPIRGGTDGSDLTEAGLPTPNIFTGGENAHSTREWVSVRGMELSVLTTIETLKTWAEKAGR
jgi:tripeptide aminopeptidase